MAVHEPVDGVEAPQGAESELDGRRTEVLQELFQFAAAALRVRSVILTRRESEGERIIAGVGLRPPFVVGALLPLAHPWARHGRRCRRTMQVTHVFPPNEPEEPPRFPDFDCAAWLAVALVDAEGQRCGAVWALSDHPRKWETNDVRAMKPLGWFANREINPRPNFRLSRNAFRRYFARDVVGGVITDPEGTILACNQQFATMFDFASPAEANGVNLLQRPGAADAFQAVRERLRAGEEVNRMEFQLTRRDGTPLRILARATASVNRKGELQEIRAYIADVTELSQLTEALHRSESRMELLERATNDVIWDWDLVSGHLSWNAAGPRRLRYPPEEMRPSIDWHAERIHSEDRERVVRGLNDVVSGVGDSWTDAYRFRRGDGTYATVLDRAYVVRNHRGDAVRVIGWMLDITELRRSEEANRFLARTGALLDSTLEVQDALAMLVKFCVPAIADHCLVYMVGPDGSTELAAEFPESAHPAGVAPIEFSACVGNGIQGDPIQHVVRNREPLLIATCQGGGGELAAAAEQNRRRDDLGVRANGAQPAVGISSLMIVPVVTRGGPQAVIALAMRSSGRSYRPVDLIVAEELAQRVALALENGRLYATAHEAVASREEVLRVVSHDLRNPVNAILTTLALLRDVGHERRSEEQKWMDIVQRAGEEMQQLIDDLLAVSTFEQGQFSISRSRVSAQSLVDDACVVLKPLADAKGLTLIREVAPDTPDVWADPRQVSRILSNLVGNAIKFTPSGGTITISVDRSGDSAHFAISDTGAGIPKAEISKVFRRFWQVRKGDRRGVGLGLPIAKGFVEGHGGRIWAESQEGRGTTFHFTLPVGERPPMPEAEIDAL